MSMSTSAMTILVLLVVEEWTNVPKLSVIFTWYVMCLTNDSSSSGIRVNGSGSGIESQYAAIENGSLPGSNLDLKFFTASGSETVNRIKLMFNTRTYYLTTSTV